MLKAGFGVAEDLRRLAVLHPVAFGAAKQAGLGGEKRPTRPTRVNPHTFQSAALTRLLHFRTADVRPYVTRAYLSLSLDESIDV